MLTLLAVVPALAPAQGGDEAKKLFEAMEERLTKAKSVSLGFSIELEVDGKKVLAQKGSLAFTEGDRARLEAEGTSFGRELKMTLTSNGKRMRLTSTAELKVKPKEVPAPKNLTRAFARMLSRSGLYMGFESLDIDRDQERELKPDDLFPVSVLKLGGKEKVDGREARILTYKSAGLSTKLAAATLWVDPLTRLPLKRVVLDGEGKDQGRLVEIYTGIKIDEKLDPKQFELPK
jgi:outer membrane lipoprotein-sorting protein